MNLLVASGAGRLRKVISHRPVPLLDEPRREAVEIPELGRGRGGPHCMSCPSEREGI